MANLVYIYRRIDIMNHRQLAISRLLQHNYNILFPLTKSKDYDFVIEENNNFKTVALIKAHYLTSRNATTNLVAKLVRGKSPTYRNCLLYCITCTSTNKVWLIPTSDIGRNKQNEGLT